MASLGRDSWSARALAALIGLPLASSACDHSAPVTMIDAGTAAGPDAGPGTGVWLTRRAPSGAPKMLPPPVDSTAVLPKPTREPDWDLSADDPARDYARRYAYFTKRYTDGFACAEFGASQPAGNQKRVEVKTAANCPGAGATRDVFLVDVAGDHLSVDDKSKRDPLALWPDGSDPEGPPALPIREIDRMQDWKSPLQDAVKKNLLVAVRVQSYGRGTYPLISLAGWHDAVQLDAPADALRPFTDALCSANGNMPLGVLSAMDRTRILRVRCPSIRWDKL
jgi:hypothetical protein